MSILNADGLISLLSFNEWRCAVRGEGERKILCTALISVLPF